MTDGVAVTPSTASTRQTIDTDEVTRGGQTVQQQVVKLSLGADGASDTLVDSGQQTSANSIPVVLPSDQTVPVSIAAILPVSDGGSTLSVDDGGGSLTIDGTVDISGTVAVSGTVTANAGSGPFPVSDNAGSLTVDDGGGSLTVDGTVAISGTVPVSISGNQAVNVAQINGVTPLMGNGASGTGAQRVTIASDSTGQIVALGNVAHDGASSGNPVRAAATASAAAPTNVSADGDVVNLWALRNGALATTLTAAGALIGGDATNGLDVDVTRLPALPAGTNNIGDVDVLTLPALPAGTNNIGDVDVLTLPALPAGTNNIGDVDVLTLPAIPAGSNLVGRVNPEPQTANGLSMSKTISAASTNATSVKGSAGQVYSIYAHNTNATARFLKLYNKASSPTAGTDTPVMTLPIPGNTAGAGFVLDTGGMGIAFGTGIALALTTGVADSDTGAVAANEIVVNILYK